MAFRTKDEKLAEMLARFSNTCVRKQEEKRANGVPAVRIEGVAGVWFGDIPEFYQDRRTTQIRVVLQ